MKADKGLAVSLHAEAVHGTVWRASVNDTQASVTDSLLLATRRLAQDINIMVSGRSSLSVTEWQESEPERILDSFLTAQVGSFYNALNPTSGAQLMVLDVTSVALELRNEADAEHIGLLFLAQQMGISMSTQSHPSLASGVSALKRSGTIEAASISLVINTSNPVDECISEPVDAHSPSTVAFLSLSDVHLRGQDSTKGLDIRSQSNRVSAKLVTASIEVVLTLIRHLQSLCVVDDVQAPSRSAGDTLFELVQLTLSSSDVYEIPSYTSVSDFLHVDADLHNVRRDLGWKSLGLLRTWLRSATSPLQVKNQPNGAGSANLIAAALARSLGEQLDGERAIGETAFMRTAFGTKEKDRINRAMTMSFHVANLLLCHQGRMLENSELCESSILLRSGNVYTLHDTKTAKDGSLFPSDRVITAVRSVEVKVQNSFFRFVEEVIRLRSANLGPSNHAKVEAPQCSPGAGDMLVEVHLGAAQFELRAGPLRGRIDIRQGHASLSSVCRCFLRGGRIITAANKSVITNTNTFVASMLPPSETGRQDAVLFTTVDGFKAYAQLSDHFGEDVPAELRVVIGCRELKVTSRHPVETFTAFVEKWIRSDMRYVGAI